MCGKAVWKHNYSSGTRIPRSVLMTRGFRNWWNLKFHEGALCNVPCVGLKDFTLCLEEDEGCEPLVRLAVYLAGNCESCIGRQLGTTVSGVERRDCLAATSSATEELRGGWGGGSGTDCGGYGAGCSPCKRSSRARVLLLPSASLCRSRWTRAIPLMTRKRWWVKAVAESTGWGCGQVWVIVMKEGRRLHFTDKFRHWRGQQQRCKWRKQDVINIQHDELVRRWVNIWRDRYTCILRAEFDSSGVTKKKQFLYMSTG